ncbi:MAG: PAS domain-containing protein [Acidobacteria bacterium]|nr:PAS domain-containing protein [Acidobacteriota bacterium]
MQLREIKSLVDSTSDAAFAVDGNSLIVAWNLAAETLFGVTLPEALGKACGSILQGMDECGEVCSRDCTIQQSVRHHHPVSNFDLQVQTVQGKKWCNISVLIANESVKTLPFSIHIVRQIDVRKKLEVLVRDFVVNETQLPAEQVANMIATTRTASRDTDLTNREIEILRLLAKGITTVRIAHQLHVSRTTINNHVQHILRKLDAHSRLEAIRRAEHAGLL